MKDYDHIVIWLDYFNKTLSRQKGSRLAKEKWIFDPEVDPAGRPLKNCRGLSSW